MKRWCTTTINKRAWSARESLTWTHSQQLWSLHCSFSAQKETVDEETDCEMEIATQTRPNIGTSMLTRGTLAVTDLANPIVTADPGCTGVGATAAVN